MVTRNTRRISGRSTSLNISRQNGLVGDELLTLSVGTSPTSSQILLDVERCIRIRHQSVMSEDGMVINSCLFTQSMMLLDVPNFASWREPSLQLHLYLDAIPYPISWSPPWNRLRLRNGQVGICFARCTQSPFRAYLRLNRLGR